MFLSMKEYKNWLFIQRIYLNHNFWPGFLVSLHFILLLILDNCCYFLCICNPYQLLLFIFLQKRQYVNSISLQTLWVASLHRMKSALLRLLPKTTWVFYLMQTMRRQWYLYKLFLYTEVCFMTAGFHSEHLKWQILWMQIS